MIPRSMSLRRIDFHATSPIEKRTQALREALDHFSNSPLDFEALNMASAHGMFLDVARESMTAEWLSKGLTPRDTLIRVILGSGSTLDRPAVEYQSAALIVEVPGGHHFAYYLKPAHQAGFGLFESESKPVVSHPLHEAERHLVENMLKLAVRFPRPQVNIREPQGPGMPVRSEREPSALLQQKLHGKLVKFLSDCGLMD